MQVTDYQAFDKAGLAVRIHGQIEEAWGRLGSYSDCLIAPGGNYSIYTRQKY